MALLPVEKRQPKLLLPKDNSTILRPETFEGGFTQSEIGTWDDCAEKWYLGYNHRLEKPGRFEMHFMYGDGVHDTLMHWYRSGEEKIATLQFPENARPTSQDEADRDMWQGILEAQMRRYFYHYKDDLEVMTPWCVEEEVEVTFMGVKFKGKLDLGYDLDTGLEGLLMDHKTFGIDDYEGWNFRFQFMFYIWLCEKALGKKIKKFAINGIRKPQLRLGKNESIESFVVRVEQAMIQEPLKYFQRHNLPMIANSMEHFEKRVLTPKVEKIKLLTQEDTPAIVIEALVRNQVTGNCVMYGSSCEFLNICKHGNIREGAAYVRRDTKHPELPLLG